MGPLLTDCLLIERRGDDPGGWRDFPAVPAEDRGAVGQREEHQYVMQACNTQATRRQSAGVFQFSLCSRAVLDSRLVVRTAVVITSGTGGTGFIGVQVGLCLRFLVCFWSISGRFLVNQLRHAL